MVEKKDSFPMISAKNWWLLRNKFKQSIPPQVTDTYTATVLDMKTGSARNNVLPYLRQVGIIDQDNKTTDRARKWRDDEQYPEVCQEIKKEVYPQDFLDAFPESAPDRNAVKRWFANHSGVGESAAKKMASFFLLLAEANPKSLDVNDVSQKKAKPQANQKPKTSEPAVNSEQKEVKQQEMANGAPSININLQIHIASDATPEQIEQIFSSMSKHFNNRKFER